MHRFIAFLPAFLLLTGCDQKAIEFAVKTGDLLTEYQSRINDQIAATNSYYQKSSQSLGVQHQDAVLNTLQAERLERRTSLEADYREGRKPVSQYRGDLRDYAMVHFARQKEWIAADLDASAPYLAQLIALQSDQSTIEAFSTAIANLSKPRALAAEIGDIKNFVEDTKKEFSKLVCDEIAANIAELKKDPSKASQLGDAQKLQKDQNCPTN